MRILKDIYMPYLINGWKTTEARTLCIAFVCVCEFVKVRNHVWERKVFGSIEMQKNLKKDDMGIGDWCLTFERNKYAHELMPLQIKD